ncbi:Probable ubiquitin-conjugating enzyme E2 24 [Linum grandiflorum]
MDVFHSDSDWENSSDSDSSSEDMDGLEFEYSGQARNILSCLDESIGKIDDFLSFEAAFARGDIVSSATNPSLQTGKVSSVHISVDLESLHGKILKGVDSTKISRIRSITVGDHVIQGPWIGRVDKVVDRITVLFDDGTSCQVDETDKEKLLLPVPPNLLEDPSYPFYPGQRVQVRLSTACRSARWLCGSWKDNQDIGTISAVKPGIVYVDWLANVLVGCDSTVSTPMRVQDANDLVLLPLFLHESWQLGDWCTLSTANAPENRLQEIFVVAKTKTVLDVVWQDGTGSSGLPSQSLLPVNVVNAHEFWPGQFVLEKSATDDDENNKWGVVTAVDAKEHTVKVKWNSSCDQVEETVSAYELVEHPDYSYCYGDIVFKGQTSAPNDKDQKDYMSCIGYVSGFKDGSVEVSWASGLFSNVAPNEIFRVEKQDGSSLTPLQDDVEEEVSQVAVDRGKQFVNHADHPWECSSSFDHQSTFGILTSIAARVLGSFSYASVSNPVILSCVREDEDELENSVTCEMKPLAAVEMQRFEKASLEQEVDGLKENQGLKSLSATQSGELFAKFDMVNDCSDHHFVDGAGKGLAMSQVKRTWLKRVQKEWSSLAEDLPESIFVRVYEERIDLVRAAIIGAPGTPYHNGLFFFDIYLPPQYPYEPPVVHYRSGGLRLNPNLYESGKICLSLLNTWTGTGSEVWNPESSSVLQVLISLQALVLNEKPYFNEAGYDNQVGKAEGEKNSISYNENAFLVTWKSMLYLLRKPPKHFEPLVEQHIKLRSADILASCKAYMDGAPIARDDQLEERETPKGSSDGFKIMLAKLLPKLVEAFSNIGIDDGQKNEVLGS